jgi:hypothetical protein
MIATPRLCLLAVASALVFCAKASAQPASAPSPIAPAYAILSLIGDEFAVVFHRPETGTRTDANERRSYPVADATLDEMALSAAEGVVKQLKPVSPVMRFSIRDPRLFALQDKLLVDSGESHGLRDALAKLSRDNQATRLVLITKWRDEAQFKLYASRAGNGKISGLGFYVDPFYRLKKINSGEASNGFLSPYAYLNVAVIDVATMGVIRSVPARESSVNMPVDANGAVRAWDALSPAAKVDALERALHAAVTSATTAALAD